MRHFPFKTLIFCVILPPLVYAFSIQMLEKAIQARYDKALAVVYTGDTRLLFDGSMRLEEAIRNNVEAFIASRKLPDWGVTVRVTVKTGDGTYLYPGAYDVSTSDLNANTPLQVARENFKLLDEGLNRSVDVEIEHNTLIANLILGLCVVTALGVLLWVYRRILSSVRQEEFDRQQILDGMTHERRQRLKQLERLESQRIRLAEKIGSMTVALEDEKQKVSATEDQMVEEMVALEEKISESLKQQERQLQEINDLRVKIEQFENENQAKARQQLKGLESTSKRFNTLYKQVSIHDRAVEGFVDLTEEMKIKAEEVIHQLNDDSKMVVIKRKVFGKKGRETVFEVIFAYKGRLYFRNLPGSRMEVVAIGTKLTQNKDLAFLEKL